MESVISTLVQYGIPKSLSLASHNIRDAIICNDKAILDGLYRLYNTQIPFEIAYKAIQANDPITVRKLAYEYQRYLPIIWDHFRFINISKKISTLLGNKVLLSFDNVEGYCESEKGYLIDLFNKGDIATLSEHVEAIKGYWSDHLIDGTNPLNHSVWSWIAANILDGEKRMIMQKILDGKYITEQDLSHLCESHIFAIIDLQREKILSFIWRNDHRQILNSSILCRMMNNPWTYTTQKKNSKPWLLKYCNEGIDKIIENITSYSPCLIIMFFLSILRHDPIQKNEILKQCAMNGHIEVLDQYINEDNYIEFSIYAAQKKEFHQLEDQIMPKNISLSYLQFLHYKNLHPEWIVYYIKRNEAPTDFAMRPPIHVWQRFVLTIAQYDSNLLLSTLRDRKRDITPELIEKIRKSYLSINHLMKKIKLYL